MFDRWNEPYIAETAAATNELNKSRSLLPPTSAPRAMPHKRLAEPRHERKCVIIAQITMPALQYASCVPSGIIAVNYRRSMDNPRREKEREREREREKKRDAARAANANLVTPDFSERESRGHLAKPKANAGAFEKMCSASLSLFLS